MKKNIILLFLVLSVLHIRGQVVPDIFIDTTDNAIDASKWLNTVTGFVPLIVPVTEPAVGYGAAGGVVFFHPNEYRAAAKEGRLNNRVGELISPTPPSLTMAGGFYTSNRSWAAGVGHLGIWKKDKVRYSIGAGGGSINLDYYGKGIFAERSRRFNLKVFGFTNELVFRLYESNWWFGCGYAIAKMDIEFHKKYNWIGIDINKKETRNGALMPSVTFDNRDNIFTPNKGIRWYLQYGHHDSWLGGTEKYSSINTYLYGYVPLAPGHVTALRFDSKSVINEPTFVYNPFLEMRGLPSMKYQDRNATLIEMEQRSKVYNRWSLVAFGGVGKTYSSFSDFNSEQLVYNYGTGLRYFLAKQYGLHMGMDFAWGPEDFAFYITFGSGWFRI